MHKTCMHCSGKFFVNSTTAFSVFTHDNSVYAAVFPAALDLQCLCLDPPIMMLCMPDLTVHAVIFAHRSLLRDTA